MKGYLAHNSSVTTVFSAPNYCYRCGNQAAIMEVNESSEASFMQYDHAPQQDNLKTKKRVPDYFL
jgi:serine/threonine-protein phosphatase 2A catalytic subunit